MEPQTEKMTTRAKDVLPNIDHMQTAEITPPPGSDGMVPSAGALHYL